MPSIDTYTTSSLTARELIRLAHAGGAVYAGNYGIVGDNMTDDTAALQAAIDDAFGPYSAPKTRDQYRVLVLPPGRIKVTSPIALSRGLIGGKIIGQGRFATVVRQNTSGESCFVTNGASYSYFGDMDLETDGGICFDLNYDGSGTNGCALQSNTCVNMFFGAGYVSSATSIGVRIGNDGFMGSENIFLSCFWIGCRYGLTTLNFNALQNTIVAGNMQSCEWGVFCGSGSVTLIDSVGFQDIDNWDIEASASAYDTIVVNACRTESANFIKPGSQGAVITGCTQAGPGTSGYFVDASNSIVKMAGCQVSGGGDGSVGGKVRMNGGGSIESCYFVNPNEDNIERCGSPRAITIESLKLDSRTIGRGWVQGKYIHDAEIPGGTIRWNYNDRDSFVRLYGEDLCMLQDESAGSSSVRANTSKSSGKWYWEVYMHFNATSAEGPGVSNASHSLTAALGSDTNGISFRSGGIYYNNASVVAMPTYTTGDTISFALDKDNNKLWARVNGGSWNNSGSDNPATNTGGYTISVTGALYPTAWVGEDFGSQVGVFQARRWKYTAPSGFAELT